MSTTRALRRLAPGAAFVLALAGACATGDQPLADDRECAPGERRCAKSGDVSCDAQGHWGEPLPCGAGTCDAKLGCIDCVPGSSSCEAGDVVHCGADGKRGEVETCDSDAGLFCQLGTCHDLCADAATTFSYLGCEYWPTITPNFVSTLFPFAVVVGNPQPVNVRVEVELSSGVIERTLAPGQVDAIELPWMPELWNNTAEQGGSRVVGGAAYHLTSSLPISAYQYNPLTFMLEGDSSCEPYSPDHPCSFSNDASLLLPTTALGTKYVSLSWPTAEQLGGTPLGQTPSELHSGEPGFVSIVATEDHTVVTVRASAHTEPGQVAALVPGETKTFTLDRRDVLELVSARSFLPARCEGMTCIGGPEYDLTGTRIEADKPVAVFGGHPCTYVPFDREACDHLEEQIFPLETWGTRYVAVSTTPQFEDHPNLWKVVSAHEGTVVTFDPPVHEPVTIGEGQSVELLHEGALQVSSTAPVLLAQLMVGENYHPGTDPGMGDPSMGLVPPVDQFRNSYDFLVPSTYTKSSVAVVAPTGMSPALDGAPITSWTTIGDTGFQFSRVEIAPGAHRMQHEEGRFSIMLSGIAPWTSYLVPGGLDLAPLVPK